MSGTRTACDDPLAVATRSHTWPLRQPIFDNLCDPKILCDPNNLCDLNNLCDPKILCDLKSAYPSLGTRRQRKMSGKRSLSGTPGEYSARSVTPASASTSSTMSARPVHSRDGRMSTW
jgi:hypothetical protein